MTYILTDFSTPALVSAIQQNLYNLFDYLPQWDRTDFHTSPTLRRWWTPVAYPWYNGVMSLQAPSADESATIRDTIAYFQAKGRDLFTWWLAPELENDPWDWQLENNGLRPDRNTPGMAVLLSELNEDPTLPAGLKISRLEDATLTGDWAHIFVTGYGLPPDWEAPLLDMLVKTGIDWPWHSYLATVNDEPVATSAVFYSAGVAGIQMVSTHPNWRGKGIGAAVTLAPLLDARKLGFRVGSLQSSSLGFNVYKRLGFKELCRMQHWYWRGEQPA